MANVITTPFPVSVPEQERRAPDYFDIRTSPLAFGGGTAAGLERLGAGLEKSGEEVFGAYRQQQELVNQIAADDASNQYQDSVIKTLYGDPATGDQGFFALRGQDAMNAWPTVAAKLSSTREQIGSGLNNFQKLEFDRATRRAQQYYYGQIGRHYEEQTKVYGVATQKAAADLAVQSAALNYNDETAFQQSLQQATQAAIRMSQSAGAPEGSPIYQENLQNETSRVISGRALAMAEKDPTGALSFAETYRPMMREQDYNALHTHLKTAATDAVANAAVARAQGGSVPRGTVSPDQVAQAATQNGIDPVLANATAAIESGHGANVGTGGHAAVRGNVFQMGPQERASVGGSPTSMGSLDQQVDQGTKLLAARKAELANDLGREPTNAEVYLAHQQGVQGAHNLIRNPNARAGDIVGDAAIRDNGGDPDAPAARFVDMWRVRYNAQEAQFRGAAAPAVTPTAQAQPIPTVPPAGGATPAPAPAPGMAELSAAEAELAQWHARAVTNLANDPVLANNLEAKEKALRAHDLEFSARQTALTAQRNAIVEARNGQADTYARRIISGQATPDILKEMAADPKLDRTTMENLSALYKKETQRTADGDIGKYGPKFYDYFQRLHLPDGDPNRIRDPSQLYQLAVPKPDGSQDLTLAGVDKLVGELKANQKPDNVAEAEIRKGAIDYAKAQISFEMQIGNVNIPDPKGKASFDIGFLPAFFKYWDAGIAAGKSPQELADRKSMDALITPFLRNQPELLRDQLKATETPAASGAQAIPTPPSAAILYLRANPQFKTDFDSKYGAGAADRALAPTAPIAH